MRKYSFVRVIFLAAAALSLLTSQSARGHEIIFEFTLTSDQVVPPTGSRGIGFAKVKFNTHSNVLIWDISYESLQGTVTGAHFHGPAGVGRNAGIEVDIGAIGGLGNPLKGSTVIDDRQKADLLTDVWYVDIDTTAFPEGEIRGQISEGDCLKLNILNYDPPGTSDFIVTGGEPGAKCVVLWGIKTGSFSFTGAGWCVEFGFAVPGNPTNRIALQGIFNSRGEFHKSLFIPGKVPNGLMFQAALSGTCPDTCMSGVVTPFEP